MSENKFGCLFTVIVAAVCITLSILLTRAIVDADIPLWLKFFLLK